jgi:peptidyl-prolyl cis-trans isomerase D
MFDFVRNHTRLALGFMLLLIIPSFVFFGVQGYSRFTDATNDTVARVGGRSIKRAEWDDAHKRYVDQLRRQAPGVDPALLDTPKLRRDTLEGMVREQLLLSAATDLHLFPNAERMRRLFDTDPQFAGLRGPDGLIRRDLLAIQGLSVDMFDQRLRQDMGVRQVLAGISQTVPAAALPASAALDAFLQPRAVELQRFEPAAYREQASPTDADIEAYYKANEAQFKAPEQASIEYAVLDIPTLSLGITLTEADLRKAYADAAARYTVPEERRSSHILIGSDKGKPAAERAQARARAEALLAEVRKSPAGFAELARKNSSDPGSAAQGGDLDFHPRGDMTPPFDDAVFKLKPGEISDVVETDFGFHIITLTAVRGGTTKPFEEVRAEVEADTRRAAGQRAWAASAELFTNTAYEQSDSLQPVLDKLKLQKQTATVSRTAPAGAKGPLASSKLLDAVFSVDAIKNKRNTDAVEVGTNQLVAARVLQHQPARLLPLVEVRERVRAQVVERQAVLAARRAGEARLALLRANGGGDPLPVVLTLSRLESQSQPKPLVDAALRADPDKLPWLTGIDLGDAGYAVLRVVQVLPRPPAPGGEEALRSQYAQAWATAEADAYIGALKKRFKAEIKPAADVLTEAASAPSR